MTSAHIIAIIDTSNFGNQLAIRAFASKSDAYAWAESQLIYYRALPGNEDYRESIVSQYEELPITPAGWAVAG